MLTYAEQPGFSKLVPGMGMPIPGAGGTYGDLSILFDIDFPKKLDDEEKQVSS
jgi:DnaJ-class molecular chaperone